MLLKLAHVVGFDFSWQQVDSACNVPFAEIVTLTQIAKIKFIVEKTDPHAFMIVQDAAEVLGHGFSVKKRGAT